MFNHSNCALSITGSSERRDTIIAEYIAVHKDEFPEWYMPLQIGRNAIPARTYPTFTDRPESLLDDTLGKRKWDLTLSKVMPDLSDKVVFDLGCNIGIFSLEMALLGASCVHGFDRGPDIVQPNNHHIGTQSVAQQAYMVRNIYEVHHGRRIPNVMFHEQDLMTFNLENVQCDVLVAPCVLYHLGAERMEEIIRDVSDHIPEVVVQANNGHGGELGKLSSLGHHTRLLLKYGYRISKSVIGPPGYPHPAVCATKEI
jgi:2-polyprenyl-3-methyl-5-hydroxy-6-metoxy-1,4-benzoquinol methylase